MRHASTTKPRSICIAGSGGTVVDAFWWENFWPVGVQVPLQRGLQNSIALLLRQRRVCSRTMSNIDKEPLSERSGC